MEVLDIHVISLESMQHWQLASSYLQAYTRCIVRVQCQDICIYIYIERERERERESRVHFRIQHMTVVVEYILLCITIVKYNVFVVNVLLTNSLVSSLH